MLMRENFKIEDTIRPRYFNKKIKFKLYIKTQNTNYELKFKSKKNVKPRLKRHRTTLWHNNNIIFT